MIFSSLALWLAWPASGSAGQVFELTQDPEVVLEHQRLPGNARAQARTRGAIRSVPHLFIYHPDDSPAFHMQGVRRNFERELSLMISDFRVQRSMAPLELLLEHAIDAEGRILTPADLPERRITMVLYRRPDCPACDQVEAALDDWIDDHPDYDPTVIRVALPE
ncbi:MAG: hypothetical protein RQ741_01560 [Wenzhouxiangellaceae bacterium]|nr:hypothetical protein [Wenzhouxiangellaceae bacterium]